MFAGLVELDDHFVPRPYLATSWEVSPDGLSYTFYLRANARFHDGTPITSEDVAFSVDTARANHPFGRSMFGPVDRVETPDPLTARFILKQRHPALLASVTTLLLPILPKHVYSVGPIRTNPANTMAIGSGPYKVIEFKAGQSITLEKNKDFFLPDQPKTDQIVFRFFDDMQASRLAIENGETDAILQTGFGYTDFARLKNNPKLNVFTNAYAGLGIVDYIEFNLRKPPFNDVRVRRAIAHAVDRKFLVEKFQAGVTKPLEEAASARQSLCFDRPRALRLRSGGGEKTSRRSWLQAGRQRYQVQGDHGRADVFARRSCPRRRLSQAATEEDRDRSRPARFTGYRDLGPAPFRITITIWQ